MVCAGFSCNAIYILTQLVDDILSDVATEANDTLGLDHVNKNRSFWRGETFSIK